MPDLFDPLRVKSWDLPSRLVMAPIARFRSVRPIAYSLRWGRQLLTA